MGGRKEDSQLVKKRVDGWSEVHFRDLKIKKCSGEEGRFGLLWVDSNDLKRLKILF